MVIAVVAGNDVARAIAKTWAVHLDKASFEKEVFRNRAAARIWIDEKLNQKTGILIIRTFFVYWVKT